MRVSTFQIHTQAAKQLQALGTQTARTQQQIAEGRRLVVPGDDPVGAARVVGLNNELGARDQFVRNIDTADVHLALEDSTLAQMTEVIHRIQELTLKAASGVLSDQDSAVIGVEIEARLEDLMALANTTNSSGQYIFGGFKGEQQPFTEINDKILYRGDQGQRRIQIDHGQSVAVNDPGQRLFMNVPADRLYAESVATNSAAAELSQVRVLDQARAAGLGKDKLVVEFNAPVLPGGEITYTVMRLSDKRPVEGHADMPYTGSESIEVAGLSFQIDGSPQGGDRFTIATTRQRSVFATVKSVAEGVQQISAIDKPEEFRQLVDATIVGLNNATDTIVQARAEIGSRLNTLSASRDLHQDVGVQLQDIRSGIEDLDFAEAVSDLAYQSFVLEAAQQSFIRINSLSLFDRL